MSKQKTLSNLQYPKVVTNSFDSTSLVSLEFSPISQLPAANLD